MKPVKPCLFGEDFEPSPTVGLPARIVLSDCVSSPTVREGLKNLFKDSWVADNRRSYDHTPCCDPDSTGCHQFCARPEWGLCVAQVIRPGRWSLYISDEARKFASAVTKAVGLCQAKCLPLRRSGGSLARGKRLLRTPGGDAPPRPPPRQGQED